MSLSHVWLFPTPWTAARQASLSIINSQSLLKLMSIESVMPSSCLILCHPLLLLPSIFPSIRVFSSESVLRIRWPKYWSFSFNIDPSNEYSGLISFRIDWFDLLAVGILNVPLVSLIFLKTCLVFPICYFPLFFCIDHWGRLSSLSLLFFGTLHSNGYMFPFILCLSLLFSAICKASSDNHFAFFVFLFLGDRFDYHLLYNVTNLRPLFFMQSIRSNPLNLFVTSTV